MIVDCFDEVRQSLCDDLSVDLEEICYEFWNGTVKFVSDVISELLKIVNFN